MQASYQALDGNRTAQQLVLVVDDGLRQRPF
jgi:hypothetical protein